MLTVRVKSKPTADIFKEQENEKKQKYKQRVLDVEMGSFTAFVFGTNGGMGGECQIFLRQIAEKLAKKNDENHASVITWLRTRLSLKIRRSAHLSVRGSRMLFHRGNEVLEDFKLNVNGAEVF